MNNPIMLSPKEIIAVFLAVCAAIVTISAAVAAIYKVFDRLKTPEKKQDARIGNLEGEVHSIHERLKLGNVRFQSDMERMDKMEKSFREINIVIIESLQALTAHAIDGNNTDALIKSKSNLDTYLREHIGGVS